MKATANVSEPASHEPEVPTSTVSASSSRRPSRRVTGAAAVGAAFLAFGLVAACSGGGGGDSAASHGRDASAFSAAGGQSADALRSAAVPGLGLSAALPPRSDAFQFSGKSQSSLGAISEAALDRSQIKTAGIALRTATVGAVVTQVEGVAATENGFVDSENTQTDTHGVATSSLLTLRVPVDSFDTAVAAVSQFGQLASKKISTQDVTGRVADVASRVTSARQSIAQLRVLYTHATKLGDIITLESELSQREADLEALEAQQRALTDQTTLATITVQITRLPKVTTTTVSHKSDDQSGFIGGIKQGWDALVTTFQSVAHGIGAALPLGITLLVIAGLAWIAIRRIPRHRVDTSG